MAVYHETFKDRIEALTGFSTINGTDGDDKLTEWLTDAASAIINILPSKKLQHCIAQSTSIQSNSTNGFDLNGTGGNYGDIIAVKRKDEYGVEQLCRIIPQYHKGRVADPDDILFATSSDPVYYLESNFLIIFPEPTSTQTANIIYIALPHILYSEGGTSSQYGGKIDRFPDDAEYLIVLYASIKAAQSLLASEEDEDFYLPMIKTLKEDYVQALNLYGAKVEMPKQESINQQ